MSPRKLEDLILTPVFSGLWKGVTGSGKTIASCGKEFRPCYTFDFEGRMDSVANYYKRLDGHCKDVEFDTFTMGESWQRVDQKMEELAQSCPYKSVNIASLTSFIHFVLKHTIEAKHGKKRSSGAAAGKYIAGIPVNELEDYNAEDAAIIFELIQFLQMLKDAGVNVFLEAHISPYDIKTGTGQNEKIETIFQVLTKGKKAPAQIPGYFNEVYLFERGYEGMASAGNARIKYTVNTTGKPGHDCKSSMGITNFDWTDADFSVILHNQLSKEVKSNPRIDPGSTRANTVKF